jgi:hypothetical protein
VHRAEGLTNPGSALPFVTATATVGTAPAAFGATAASAAFAASSTGTGLGCIAAAAVAAASSSTGTGLGCIAATAVAAAIHALLAPGAVIAGVAPLLVISHRVVTGSTVRLIAVTPLLRALVAGALVPVADSLIAIADALVPVANGLIAIADALVPVANGLIAIADALVPVADGLIAIADALVTPLIELRSVAPVQVVPIDVVRVDIVPIDVVPIHVVEIGVVVVVSIDERIGVGDVDIVVVAHAGVIPAGVPGVIAPSATIVVVDSRAHQHANTEGDYASGHHGFSRVTRRRRDGGAVNCSGIVAGHIHNVWLRRLNHDRLRRRLHNRHLMLLA